MFRAVRRATYFAVLTAVLTLGAGCADKESLPPLYPTKGTVLIEGAPPPEGTVVWLSATQSLPEGVRAVQGITKADGSFSLTTFSKQSHWHDGAPAGEYVASLRLTQYDPTVQPPPEPKFHALTFERKYLKYALAKKSPLRVTVKEVAAGESNDVSVKVP